MCFKTHPWYSIPDKIRSHFEWLYFIINGVPFQFRGAAIGSSFAYENHEWSSVGPSTTPKSFKKHPESVLYLWTCIPLKRLIVMLMSHDSNGSYHLRNATVVLLHQQNFYPFRFVWDDDEHQVLSGHIIEWIAAGARWIGEGEVVDTSLYLCDNF